MWMFAIAAAAPVVPERVTVPAAGRHEVVVEVSAFGRYALAASSDQGTSLQVIDAATGPGPVEEDGQAALFLDRGRVKVVLAGDPRASGDATLTVRPFAEAEASARLLPAGRQVVTTLGEAQQRSYWLDLGEDRTVNLDVAGRYVGDVRLWHEGTWLVDAEPACDTVTPAPGQPWARCALSADLSAGLYLVTVYGGGGEPWAQQSAAAPLVVREGAPVLGEAGQLAAAIGPSGYERYWIPEGTQRVHLALPDVAEAGLTFGTATAPGSPTAHAEITAQSRRPTATIAPGPAGWVTVRGAPGQRVQLTWFGGAPQTVAAGDWYIATVHAADPRDVLDPTAVLFGARPDRTWNRTAAQGIPLDKAHRVERTFNLSGKTSVLLDVVEAGLYRIAFEGERAQAQIRPLVQGAPLPPADVMERTDLDVGLYELLLEQPVDGVATLRIAPDGAAKAPLVALRPCISFANVHTEGDERLAISVPPGTAWGVVQRALPLDPTDPVPLALLAGERLELPLHVAEVGVLRATTLAGALLPISVDGGPWGPAPRLQPGEHRIAVRADAAASASLAFVVDRLAPERPLPPLAAARTASLPRFASVAPGRPAGLDLDRGEIGTVSLQIPEAGLYRVESTGLVATSGAVRTRTTPRLAGGESNGIGRNFLVQRYLDSGEYQVSVRADSAAGHVGVRVVRAAIDDGGVLRPGSEARATVPAGAAVRYVLDIPEAGWYHVRHASASILPCRLEDADGWPIVAPDAACDWTIELAPGEYALLGGAEDVETRRHTVLEAIRAAVERVGHGPFVLPIGGAVSHVWREPTGDEPRSPDVWTLALAAPVHGSLALSPEMEAELAVNGQFVGRSSPGRPFAGEIPAGDLRIEVRGARQGTGVPYTLTLTSAELVAGAEQGVDGAARLPVSVGATGVYTFTSRGSADVRARLVDEHGRRVAANDDRPDDRNFRITVRLDPGRYTLEVDPIVPPAPPPDVSYSGRAALADTGYYGEGGYTTGPDTGSWGEDEPVAELLPPAPTVVEMRAPAEVEGPPLGRGPLQIVLADRAVALALQRPASSSDVVVARATSGENVGIAIESQEGNRWTPLTAASGRAPVAVARVGWAPLRLRVWSEDLRGIPATVEVDFVQARAALAADLARGIDGGRITAVRTIDRGAQYRVEGPDRGAVFVCGSTNHGCPRTARTLVSGRAEGLVVVGVDRPLRVERVELRDAPLDLELAGCTVGPGTCGVDLPIGLGPVAVIARGSTGQPVAALPGGWTAAADGAALAFSGTGSRRVDLWEGAGAERLDVAVQRVPLAAPSREPLARGRSSWLVPAGGLLYLEPSEAGSASIALESGLAAAVDQLGAVWAAPAATTVRVQRVERRIALVNPTDRAAYAVVDLSPVAAAETLTAGRPFEQLGSELVTWLVPVESGAGELRARGAVSARYRALDGRVVPAEGATVGSGGVLVAAVRPGAALVWAEDGASGPAVEVDAGDPVDVVGNGVVSLSGPARRLRVQPLADQIPSVLVPVPVVARVSVAGRPDRIEILSGGERLDLLTGGLPAYVVLRALRGASLYGDALVTSSPIVPTRDGLGPEQLVVGGGVAFYSFTADRAGPVGIGVRSAAGRVDAVLYDADGQERARGALAMLELAPGEYLLALSQPGGSAPARVQPAIVGLLPAPSGPPPEVAREYARARQ